jgi:hypothetical protein
VFPFLKGILWKQLVLLTKHLGMKSLCTSLLLICSLAGNTQTNYYVKTPGNGGSNVNPCSSGSPCATISHVISTYSLGANDTVFVGVGTFSEGITLTTSDEGDATGHLVITGVDSSQTVLQPPIFTSHAVNLNGANYVKFRNFKVDDADEDLILVRGGSNNVIEHCWLVDGWDNVQIESTGSTAPLNTEVAWNYMQSSAFIGIDMNGTSSDEILGTVIHDNIIDMGNNSSSLELTHADNTIIYRNKLLGGDAGIYFTNTGGADNTEIYNNYIAVGGRGLENRGTTANSSNGKLRFNSFYTGEDCIYFNLSNVHRNWEVKNNIFYTTSSSSSDYCIKTSGANNFDECNYNTYYHPSSARCATFNGSARATLANWQAVSHSDAAGDDGNSTEEDPLYMVPASGNLDLQATSPLNNQGTSIVSILNDINLYSRDANPTIGAFELIGSLPVELIHFSGKKVGESVELNWTTATEIDNDYFLVEHSTDGFSFEWIGTVEGAGTSNQPLHYILLDQQPVKGVNYYRLKQVDFNGATETHNTIAIEFKTLNSEYLLFPNPVIGNALNLSGNLSDIVSITILNQLGQPVKSISTADNFKSNLLQGTQLSEGLYYIRIFTKNGDTIAQPFVYKR